MRGMSDEPDELEKQFLELQVSPLPQTMSRLVPQYAVSNDATPIRRRSFWAVAGCREYPQLAQVALRLLSMHATSCASERNWSLWGSIYVKSRNRLAIARAEKLVFIRGNSSSSTLMEDMDVALTLLEESSD